MDWQVKPGWQVMQHFKLQIQTKNSQLLSKSRPARWGCAGQVLNLVMRLWLIFNLKDMLRGDSKMSRIDRQLLCRSGLVLRMLLWLLDRQLLCRSSMLLGEGMYQQLLCWSNLLFEDLGPETPLPVGVYSSLLAQRCWGVQLSFDGREKEMFSDARPTACLSV